MTVTYSLNVAKARLCGFAKLLLRWKGSIYKLLYREMIIFCSLYYSLSYLYRYVLVPDQKIVFEKLALYCEAFTKLIPLSFVLGFYVSIVVGRWWNQFMAIPYPDKMYGLVAAYVHGPDERGRMIRRTLARYLMLLLALTFQGVSTAVKKRFPTVDYLIVAGLMTKEEKIAYENVLSTHGKWWVPVTWFNSLILRCRKENRIKDDIFVKQILDELYAYRTSCGLVFAYDWISIPLVYTQTVTIATYTYFLATVMGRQYLDPSKGYSNHDIDLYVPVFTILEFFFFMGWLKVAEQLINPFGEDDDDFELNWILDRNLLVGMYVVDELYNKCPKITKDIYWDDFDSLQLPYTKSSAKLRNQPHLGSAINLDVSQEAFEPLTTIMEEDTEENSYNSPPQSPTDTIVAPSFPPTASTLDVPTKDSETSSVSALRFLSDFGSNTTNKVLNMIMGQSNENVNQTPSKQPTFLLKSPKKKRRNVGTASSMTGSTHMPSVSNQVSRTNSIVLSDINKSTNESSQPIAIPRRSPVPNYRSGGTSTPAERRSLIDFDRADNQPFINRPGSSAEEADRLLRFTPDPNKPNMPSASSSTTVTSTRPVSRTGESLINMPDGDNISEVGSIMSEVLEMEPPKAEVQLNATEESPYEEQNSSSESLSPYASNQSTVTSITELLRRNKKSPNEDDHLEKD